MSQVNPHFQDQLVPIDLIQNTLQWMNDNKSNLKCFLIRAGDHSLIALHILFKAVQENKEKGFLPVHLEMQKKLL